MMLSPLSCLRNRRPLSVATSEPLIHTRCVKTKQTGQRRSLQKQQQNVAFTDRPKVISQTHRYI